jgi:hypothetical protein
MMSTDPFDPQLYVRQRPPAPPRRPFRRKLQNAGIRIAAAAAVAACGFGVEAAFDDDEPDKRRTSGGYGASTPTPTRTPPPTSYSPPPPPTATATRSTAPPSPTTNPLDSVDKGDCVKNTGTDYDPEMVPVACGPGTYQVLLRLYGTTSSDACDSVPGYTTSYTVTYYVNNIPQAHKSYVFCMKRR